MKPAAAAPGERKEHSGLILVTGATGNVGRKLVSLLRADDLPVRAATRRPNESRLPAAVDIHAADLGVAATIPPLLGGIDQIFLMIPIPGDPSHMGNFVRAVRDSAVRHIVFLSSLSTQSDIDGDLVGRFHREAEEALIALGIPLTLLRPGTFMANACYWAPQLQAGDVVKGIPYEAAAPIDEHDIARVAFAALTDGSLAGRTFPLTGPEAISSGDQVRILGEVLGRKLRFEPLDPDGIRAMIRNSLGDDADADAVLESVASRDVPWARPLPGVAAVTGSPAGGFREWARRNAEWFQPVPRP